MSLASFNPFGRGAVSRVVYGGEDEYAAQARKLLNAVIADEDDSEKWETLASFTAELEGGINRNSSPHVIDFMRNVFDCLLAKFPLFYGYWKKYADIEFAIGGTETADMVYERGVASIPNCVDLWTHYCSFTMDTCHKNDKIRDLFERGVEAVGIDYHCHPLWDKYIEFENRIGAFDRITLLLRRIIRIPTYNYNRYYEKFRQIVHSRPINELISDDKLAELKHALDMETATAGLLNVSPLELDRALRGKIEAYYYPTNQLTATETQKRWVFESGIKRAYFVVNDLEPADLENWRNYLDFEEAEGNYERIVFLYERCLVACALYDEFWLRYARWMFAQGKDEDTRIIYLRASTIFAPIAHTTVRLHWARFEEKLGRFPLARDIHSAILEQIPGHLETILSMANLERRHLGNDAAIALLEEHIQALLEQQTNQEAINVAGQLTAEQARILSQCKGSAHEARELFQDRHRNYLSSRDFWMKYLEFEITQSTPGESDGDAHARVKGVYDLLRKKGQFPLDTMRELSEYYMAYLLDHGDKTVAKEYIIIDKEVNGPSSVRNKQTGSGVDDGKESASDVRLVLANGHHGSA